MFLTRMELNPARRRFRHLAANPRRMHAAVESALPPGIVRTRRNLWRLDNTPGRMFLYILSEWEPDLEHVAEQAGWPSRPEWTTRPYDALLSRLEVDQIWAFRLTANATRSGRKTPGSGQTQRFAHVTAAQQADWLLRRTNHYGFSVAQTADGDADLFITNRVSPAFAKGEPTNGNRTHVTFRAVTYEGKLIIGDVDRLRHALITGIGPAKAYGCGLMTLAR